MTYISRSSDFALYLEVFLIYDHHLWDYDSVLPDVGPKINVGHYDLYFMVQWFCLIYWRLFDVWRSYFRVMSQYDLTFDLKINVGHCDLYFIVQWFCLISWRLFDVWTSYFGIMTLYDTTFNLKINIGHRELYCMVQWFCLIPWRLLDVWASYSVWHNICPQIKCRSLWPIFHGPVILPYICLSFFLYVLTSMEDISRGSVYKCKGGVSWIKEVNS